MAVVNGKRRQQGQENPPIYLATLAALIGRDPSFLQGERITPQRPGDQAQVWTRLDMKETA